ncbi:MAG: glycosyltransferase family 1 protein [Candidatus Daviesbacteria bacterium]|nr:glycosyltransferase family 1 protein [Candidatus Daviesbacteria bacterium]
MKVGFDISQLAFSGGVSTYTQNLAKHLSKDLKLETVFFYSSLRKGYLGDLKNVKQFKIPPTITEILFNRFRILPIESFIGDIDIFHSSDWTQPKTKAKKITTYHDLVPIKYPQWSSPKVVDVHKRRLKLVESEIDHVIAVSQSTKKDLLDVSSIPENKITVIYEAAAEYFKPQNERRIEEFRLKYKLPKVFVLAIGGVGERRNLDRVKKATNGDYPLIITGQDLPYLKDEEMPLLYSAAAVLLYPSLYEGFGLPVLEAMQSGVPVITSNISSLPEIGGDAVLYVDPLDTSKIKIKLKEVLEDKKLHTEMIKKGLIQAKEFSWEKCADETAEVYERVLSYNN